MLPSSCAFCISHWCFDGPADHASTLETTPAPTVRPPSMLPATIMFCISVIGAWMGHVDHASTLETTPAPTVRPPSRMANLSPGSMATGLMSSNLAVMLSPGMTISMPSGSVTVPAVSP